MSRIATLGLRALQILLAISNIGTATYVANWYITGSRLASPSSLNFLIFAPIFSIVSVLYLELAPRLAPRASHPISALVVEGLNVIFYLAGFIAFAVFLSRLTFCTNPVCAVGKATAVLAAAEFSAWVATMSLMAKDVFKGGLRKPTTVTRTGPVPQMGQAITV